MKHWWTAANTAHGSTSGNLLEAAEAFGVIIDGESVTSKDCEVWQENVETVNIFLYCSTQWRMAVRDPSGPDRPYGLDYNTVFSMMDLYNVKDKQSVMEGVQIMEHQALILFHKKT